MGIESANGQAIKSEFFNRIGPEYRVLPLESTLAVYVWIWQEVYPESYETLIYIDFLLIPPKHVTIKAGEGLLMLCDEARKITKRFSWTLPPIRVAF